jgi:HTH-type transcriptional regulator/antitoxin HigA
LIPYWDRLEVLATLVEVYEDRHYNIPLPDPVEAILYHLESRGLNRRDLEPFIGSRARVSEILNRRRSLSLDMIRKLSSGLGISAEVLIQPYDTGRAA